MSGLHTLVIDSLVEEIAIIDGTGKIVDVNAAWEKFGHENGLASTYCGAGGNYLEVLAAAVARGDGLAAEAQQGILDVINGARDFFYCEYPCHSPEEKRWFMMRVTRVRDHPSPMFVITHHDITQRKLAEERAEDLAMHDALTGLANRRYFNLCLSREMRRSARNQSPISLIEVDLDHFKEYNDSRGHLAGDKCLASVGGILQEHARRPTDVAARLGGDEFALLLGEADVVQSQQVAEAVLQAVRELAIECGESTYVTASVGVASMIPRESHGGELLMQEADEALYHAKMSGRNRVVRAAFAVAAS